MRSMLAAAMPSPSFVTASVSAQEAQDLAAIGHAVTLSGRVPVLHFFDGFRTVRPTMQYVEMGRARTNKDSG
jgi:pyruvate/2-oxoacid:ferredoxin oxidoreductase alpha subunit